MRRELVASRGILLGGGSHQEVSVVDVFEAINGRRSIRCFDETPVEKKTLQKIIDASSMAPSTMNSQPWHFHVVTGEKRDALAKILNRSTLMLADVFAQMDADEAQAAVEFFADLGGASVIIVVSSPEAGDDHYTRLVDLIGTGCAIQNLQLAAHAEGLGTCVLTISFWVKEDISKFLRIEDRDIVCCVIAGKAALQPEATGRRDDIVDWVGL